MTSGFSLVPLSKLNNPACHFVFLQLGLLVCGLRRLAQHEMRI